MIFTMVRSKLKTLKVFIMVPVSGVFWCVYFFFFLFWQRNFYFAFHMTGWQNVNLSHKNVNIKAHKTQKNKEKFELFTIDLNF
jgi:hypothetical protein